MKKILLFFLVAFLLIPVWFFAFSHGKYFARYQDVEALEVALVGPTSPTSPGGPIEEAVGGYDLTEDWTSYAASDDHLVANGGPWNSLDADDGSVDVANDEFDGGTADAVVIVYQDQQLATITQYATVHFGLLTHPAFSGVYLRSTNSNGDVDGYAIRVDTAARQEPNIRYCGEDAKDVGDCTTIGTCDLGDTLYLDDSLGARVTGTGLDTVFELWHWQNAAAPTVTSGDVDTAWGAAACTLCVSVAGGGPGGCTTEVAGWGEYADTGRYVGVYDGSGVSGTPVSQTWAGGDSTN